MQATDKDPYKNTLRIRACGILKNKDRVLLVKLHSPVSDSLIWTAPGGGVKQGERIKSTVEREFAEETGLQVRAGEVMLIHELLDPPYHAVEFFFEVEYIDGTLKTGYDPEREESDQIIATVGYISASEMEQLDIRPGKLKEMLLESGSERPPIMALKQD